MKDLRRWITCIIYSLLTITSFAYLYAEFALWAWLWSCGCNAVICSGTVYLGKESSKKWKMLMGVVFNIAFSLRRPWLGIWIPWKVCNALMFGCYITYSRFWGHLEWNCHWFSNLPNLSILRKNKAKKDHYGWGPRDHVEIDVLINLGDDLDLGCFLRPNIFQHSCNVLLLLSFDCVINSNLVHWKQLYHWTIVSLVSNFLLINIRGIKPPASFTYRCWLQEVSYITRLWSIESTGRSFWSKSSSKKIS